MPSIFYSCPTPLDYCGPGSGQSAVTPGTSGKQQARKQRAALQRLEEGQRNYAEAENPELSAKGAQEGSLQIQGSAQRVTAQVLQIARCEGSHEGILRSGHDTVLRNSLAHTHFAALMTGHISQSSPGRAGGSTSRPRTRPAPPAGGLHPTLL